MRAIILAGLLAAGCDASAPDGSGLVVELLPSASPKADVLLALHGRGGASIFVTVDSGSFRPAGSLEPATRACLADGTAGGEVTFELAVAPSDDGTLLSAGLFVSNDCTGDVVQSHLLVVQRPALTPTTDAGPQDAP